MDLKERLVLADRYEIGPVIGRGGMAVVRRAFDRRLSRTVAVKCFDRSAASTPTGRARFEAEARAGASVSHPNVITVYDVGVDEGVPFIVMECLPGSTFADEIARGPLNIDRMVGVMRDVLAGLGAAHDRGILHRDLKPGNVLTTGDGVMKLADFGIAWSEDRGTLTDAGILLGTPAYLAPERIQGEPAGVRSDLYSVGVMCYEAITGARPFTGNTAVAVAYAVQHGPVQPLRALRDDITSSLAEVVTRAMARLPEDRFASADEFGAALEDATSAPGFDDEVTRPIEVMPEPTRVLPTASPAPPRQVSVRRHVRAPLLGGVAALALVGAGFVAAAHGSGPSTPATKTSVTAKTLPGALRAPFNNLERAVGK